MKFVLVALYTIALACAFVGAYPNPVEDQVQNPSEESVRAQRHIGGGQFPHGYNDHVDFGAHTGDRGAFGWYADFPVQ